MFIFFKSYAYSLRQLRNSICQFNIRRTKLHAYIPSEIGADDKIVIIDKMNSLSKYSIPYNHDYLLLAPNIDIASVNGGENLGVLIWTVVLFNGIC